MTPDQVEKSRRQFVDVADRVILKVVCSEARARDLPSRYVMKPIPMFDTDVPVVLVELQSTDPKRKSASGHLRFEVDLGPREVVASLSLGASHGLKTERTDPDREGPGRFGYRQLNGSEVREYIDKLVARVFQKKSRKQTPPQQADSTRERPCLA